MAELEKPKEEKPTPNQQAIEDLSWDVPFFRTIWNFFVREGQAVKHGWLAVAIIVGITIWLTRSITRDSISDDVSNLKGQLADAKQDRNHYQEMLAPFQAMAISKYTNAPLDQRLDLLARGLLEITNVLKGLNDERPRLVIRINGKDQSPVDNSPHAVVNVTDIFIGKAEPISISAVNLSKYSAQNITIQFFAEIDPTNLFSVNWTPQPSGEFNRNHWMITANVPTGQYGEFIANPLIISTNFQSQYLDAFIYVNAANSSMMEVCVKFTLNKSDTTTLDIPK